MSFYKTTNSNYLSMVYGISNPVIHVAYQVGSAIDNLHYDFLKKYKYIPKESITCANSKDIYKLIV